MSCCGGDSSAGSLRKKREALLATPFFSAAATDESSTHLVERVAEEAVLLKVKAGKGLNDPPFGTFVVVVEGELKHTEVRNNSSRKVSSPATVKPATDDAMATRRKGDLFRVAGIGGSSKLHKMAGNELSRIVAVQRSIVLLIEPDALTRALARTKQDSADGGGLLASILQEMASQEISSLIARVPCFAPLNERLRSTLAQLFSYDILTPKATLFQEGEKGETLCILLHGELEVLHKGEKVATRVPQAFLGEIALLYNCERTASISNGPEVASVLTLRAEHFRRMLDRVPDMREQIEATQRSRMVYSFMVLSGLYLKDVTEESVSTQCGQMAKRVVVRSVPAGTVLSEGVGKRNSEFVMLYQGVLKRTRYDGGMLGAMDEQTLSPGGYAGGVAMLRCDGTSERIVAASACLLLVAEGDEFFGLLGDVPSLHAQLLLRSFGGKAPLEGFLNYPAAFEMWLEHQKSEYASESSEFWSDTNAFLEEAKKEPPPEDLAARAKLIVETYVVDGCEKQVNLPSAVQQAAIAAAGATPFTPDLFDASRKELYSLMRRDTLPRFLQTDRYTTILSTLAEPLPIPENEPPASLAAAQAAYSVYIAAQGEGLSTSVVLEDATEKSTPREGDDGNGKGPSAAQGVYSPNYNPS